MSNSDRSHFVNRAKAGLPAGHAGIAVGGRSVGFDFRADRGSYPWQSVELRFLGVFTAEDEWSVAASSDYSPYNRFGFSLKIFCANDGVIEPPRARVWIASMSLE